MKNWKILMMLVASFALVFTSCKKDEPEQKPVEITLNVAGGTSVTVDGADVTKDITVTASEASADDLAISLSSDAAEGEAAFENAVITLKKGETSVVGKITFKADKFPQGTAEKAIKVTIKCDAENVKLGTAETTFKVSGANGAKMVELTGTAPETEFNTTDAAQTAVINITLSEALDTDLTINGEILESSTLSADKITGIDPVPPMKIAAGEKTLTISLTVAQGAEGVLEFGNFSTDNERVSVEVETLKFTFTVTAPTSPLCAVAGDFNASWAYVNGFTVGDLEKSDIVSNNALVDMVAEVANVAEGGALKIVGQSGDGDQTAVATMWIDWNGDGQLTPDEIVLQNKRASFLAAAAAVVAEGTLAAPAGTPAGTYYARIGSYYKVYDAAEEDSGCAARYESCTFIDIAVNYTAGGEVPAADYVASIAAENTDVTVGETGSVNREFTVSLNKPAEKAFDLEMEVSAAGDLAGASLNPTVVLFEVGEQSKTVTISLDASAIAAGETSGDVTVTLVSLEEGVTVDPSAESIVYKLTKEGSESGGEKQDLQIFWSVEMPAGGDVFFAPGATDPVEVVVIVRGEEAVSDVVLTPVIEGFAEGDYGFDTPNVTIKGGEFYVRLYMTVNPSAVGKTAQLKFVTDDATIKEGAGATISAKELSAPSEPADIKLRYTLGGGTTVESCDEYWYMLSFEADAEIPEGTLLKPVLTGDLTEEDFNFEQAFGNPIVISEGKKKGYVAVLPSAKGKKGTLTFTSEYVTFADGAGITFDIAQ